MNKANIMKNTLISSLMIGALSVAAGSASAATVDLCAGATTMDLPDGTSVPMWGYAPGVATAGVCDSTPTFPGSRITVPTGETTFADQSDQYAVGIDVDRDSRFADACFRQ